MSGRRDRIVIVGASLAGLRTAQALREQGHDGELTVVGDEPHLPYDRPPLSKQLLDGSWTRAQLDLPVAPDLDVQWRLGQPAHSLDLGTRTVHLGDGQHLAYDGLVLATGARARPWPGTPPPGVLSLRSADDAAALSAAMTTVDRLLVVGAGFLGGEVAAAARRRGLAVTLVEPQDQPLLAVGGPVLGAFVADLHRNAGVNLRLTTRVATFNSDSRGRLSGADLDDGTQIAAELALVALGALPNIDWLAGSGLVLDSGVVCNALCQPVLADGTVASGVVAAGDIARWPHPLRPGATGAHRHSTPPAHRSHHRQPHQPTRRVPTHPATADPAPAR